MLPAARGLCWSAALAAVAVLLMLALAVGARLLAVHVGVANVERQASRLRRSATAAMQ